MALTLEGDSDGRQMQFDVIIIGAGLSGLAAGIRLAQFDRRVCILEKHYAYGGLNSYYRLGGRNYDVGLHAMTNFAPPGARGAPLSKILRQLRISRDELDLREQTYSEIRFPGRCLRFSNDPSLLFREVEREFPVESARFARLVERIEAYDDHAVHPVNGSARELLSSTLGDRVLGEMLLCPVMYYGNAGEHDMELCQFVTIFKSLFREGLARPFGGIRTLLKALVRRFRACGGRLRTRCGVRSVQCDGERAVGVTLESGEEISAAVILSCAGGYETMRLCEGRHRRDQGACPGRISFVECQLRLDVSPQALGHRATIVFYNQSEKFRFACPEGPVDLESGIVCCPSNYDGHEDFPNGQARLTWLASYDQWSGFDEVKYRDFKAAYLDRTLDELSRFMPGIRGHVVADDMFTPRTIENYTGHINGAVYGAPRKVRDGRTGLANLFLCGTDQGYLGIIGAMLSGITMANMHVLGAE